MDSNVNIWFLTIAVNKTVPRSTHLTFFCNIDLSAAALADSLCTPNLFLHRLGDGVPRPGQRRKPGSPRRLSFSGRRWQPPGRASGKPNRPSLLHAELLLHLLTLINAHPHLPPAPPFTSELQLMESVHQHACGTKKQQQKDKKHPKCTS